MSDLTGFDISLVTLWFVGLVVLIVIMVMLVKAAREVQGPSMTEEEMEAMLATATIVHTTTAVSAAAATVAMGNIGTVPVFTCDCGAIVCS